MNPVLRTFLRSNVWAFPIFASVLYVANWLLVADAIPGKQIALISVLFAVYYSWIFFVVMKVLRGKWREKIVGICAMLLLLITIEPLLEFLIYSYFPSIGVYLDKYMLEADYVHDASEFRQRWITALLFIFSMVMLRIGFRLLKRKGKESRLSKRRTKEMEKEVGKLHSRLNARQLNPHFIENFVAIALAKEARNSDGENEGILMMLTQLLSYQLNMDNGQQLTGWQDELEQVDNLLEMASYVNGSFFYEREESEGLRDLKIDIPHGLLLMPLENALKYGKNIKQWPLQIVFTQTAGRIWVRYTNYFNPVQRNRIKSSGTGFQLMEARLSGGSWPITLHKREEGGCFCVEIEITLRTPSAADL